MVSTPPTGQETDRSHPAAGEAPFQFRIRDLLLVMLLVALAAGAIAQQSGLLFLLLIGCGAYCLWLWQLLRPARLVYLLLGGGIAVVTLMLVLLPAVSTPRWAGRRMSCQNNLKQIAIALHNYHDTYGTFPPAYLADETGRPMHSWRVLILPFMEQENLYKRYRFDEPWDGPNNRQLAGEFIPIYACPEEQTLQTDTSYVAIVGPDTAWPGEKGRSLNEFTDGTANVLLVVEIHDSGIHWMEPRDLHVTQMAPTIDAPHGQGISSLHKHDAQAAFADASIRVLRKSLPADVLRSWINLNDGTLPEPETK